MKNSSVTPSSTDSSCSAPQIEYLVQMPQPWTHHFHVTMTVAGLESEEIHLAMPVWTPGSYLVREFARNVRGFSATDEAGDNLRWHKSAKNRWTVHSRRVSKLKVTYQVYAFERSVRTSFLDDTGGIINGASVFMFVEGHSECPHILRIEPFPSWGQITTGLDSLGGEKSVFLAPDFDTLVDSPVLVGNHQLRQFTAGGVLHRVAISGEGNPDPEKICTGLQKIAEQAKEIAGEIPCPHYTFLIQLTLEWGGGLEHANCTLLQVHRWAFKSEESYNRFLSLAAHEYFHVWNVKRIRPAGLGPFDLSRENYTRQLWISEGFTDYYADLILRRAGLLSPDAYLEGISKSVKDLMEVPGRLEESVAEASFDAWIKFYRQDADSPNRSVSYYLKGGLIGLLLDLEIRNRLQGKSLDDVLRLLYRKFYRELDRGFTEAEFKAACEEVAQGPLDRFFDEYCYGTVELDIARYLGYAGLRFKEPVSAEQKTAKGYLGISVKTVDGRILIIGVTRGSPAYEQGLNVNDEIISADGFRMNQELLTARIGEAPPGYRMEFLVARDGRLVSAPVVLGVRDESDYKIERNPESTLQQKRIYEEWLCAKWQDPHPEGASQREDDPAMKAPSA